MMKMLLLLIWIIRSVFVNKPRLVMENLALRHQLTIMRRSIKRPGIHTLDRLFWILLSRLWDNWRECLILVKPQTVVKWHRQSFKLFWRRKSRPNSPGRPNVSPEIRELIRKMTRANPFWGAPRIHGELLRLGVEISERTVSRLIPKRKKPPSATWRAFIKNHMHNTCAMDFFTAPTAAFKILFVLVIFSHKRRKIIHCNVTANPTAPWTAQQLVEAFPWDTAPKYVIRDRDSIYGAVFRNRLKNMNIEEVRIAPRSPWQNAYVERVIGSIRRECLDHVIILNKRHLKKILSDYLEYYNEDRTHLGLGKDAPNKRPVQHKPQRGKLSALPRVGGLHHRYEWKKAA